MKDTITINYNRGTQEVHPVNELVSNYLFTDNEHSEAKLAHALGEVAQKNGMSANDMAHLFPVVLRMLKSDIAWAK